MKHPHYTNKEGQKQLGIDRDGPESTAGERFAMVGANGTFAIWDRTHGLRCGQIPPHLRAEMAVGFAMANLDAILSPAETPDNSQVSDIADES